MHLKQLLLVSSLTVNGILSADAIHADEVFKLKIIAASQSHTEVLIVQQSGNIVRWRLIFPPGLEARGPGHADGDADGEVNVGLLSIQKEFENIVRLQTDAKQRERIRDTQPSWPTFVLLMESDFNSRISWPLTEQEQNAFVGTELMKRIFEDINSHQLLLKPHHLLDFSVRDRRRSLIEFEKREKGELK